MARLRKEVAKAVVRELLRGRYNERVWFWTGQGINLVTAVLFILGLLAIWFDNPNRLATAVGLVTAGVAFALQKVITALAGYFVILQRQDLQRRRSLTRQREGWPAGNKEVPSLMVVFGFATKTSKSLAPISSSSSNVNALGPTIFSTSPGTVRVLP